MSGAPIGRPAHVIYEYFLKNLVRIEWQFFTDVL